MLPPVFLLPAVAQVWPFSPPVSLVCLCWSAKKEKSQRVMHTATRLTLCTIISSGVYNLNNSPLFLV